jgi:hypothetical protein
MRLYEWYRSRRSDDVGFDCNPLPHNIKKTHPQTVGSFLPVHCILLRLTLVHLH